MKQAEKAKTGFEKTKGSGSIRNIMLNKRKGISVGERTRNQRFLGGARIAKRFYAEPYVFLQKGQIKFDFIFALIFFTIIIFFIGIQVSGSLSSSLTDSKLDTMKSEANSILSILAATGGSPSNWEALPPEQRDNIARIGLASSPFNISTEAGSKLDKLKNNCGLMDKFGSINYKLVITNATNILLSCGYGGPRVTSKSEMPVVVGGSQGKAVLEMW